MNIKGLHLSFRGEKFLSEDKTKPGIKTGTKGKVKRDHRHYNLDKILKVISKPGGVVITEIIDSTELSVSCVRSCVNHLLDNEQIKREFIVEHGANRLYSYSLINDTVEPYNPQKEMFYSVLELMKGKSELTKKELIDLAKTSNYKINKALDFLIENNLISVRQCNKSKRTDVFLYQVK